MENVRQNDFVESPSGTLIANRKTKGRDYFPLLEEILESAPSEVIFERFSKNGLAGFRLSNNALKISHYKGIGRRSFREMVEDPLNRPILELVFKIDEIDVIIYGWRGLLGTTYDCFSVAGIDRRESTGMPLLMYDRHNPQSWGPGKPEWYGIGARLLNRAAEKYNLDDWINVYRGNLALERVGKMSNPPSIVEKAKSYLSRSIRGYLPI